MSPIWESLDLWLLMTRRSSFANPDRMSFEKLLKNSVNTLSFGENKTKQKQQIRWRQNRFRTCFYSRFRFAHAEKWNKFFLSPVNTISLHLFTNQNARPKTRKKTHRGCVKWIKCVKTSSFPSPRRMNFLVEGPTLLSRFITNRGPLELG